MRWLIGIGINAILFIALAGYFENSFYIEGFGAALAASFILAILNMLVRPILIILTLPITIVTLGAFLLVINALTLLLTDELVGSSFEIEGFWMAFFIALIMSIVNVILQKTVFRDKKENN
ncbi:phage holin family protein [Robertmurraya korlensis]|uniref:phage holin family protein n=1 Tax=Robertmurraya korlensis TaxID=519977 RepID=UPI00203EF53A|nr:phage holin family protein [Robertmurraya korlensis]MCM3602523.1 phage holin family protein [Robertmurraya korlensis]